MTGRFSLISGMPKSSLCCIMELWYIEGIKSISLVLSGPNIIGMNLTSFNLNYLEYDGGVNV